MPNLHLRIIVDECNNFEVSHFYQKKDLMTEGTCELLEGWRRKGMAKWFK